MSEELEKKRKTVPFAHIEGIRRLHTDPEFPMTRACKLLTDAIPDDSPAEEIYDRELMRQSDLQALQIRSLLSDMKWLKSQFEDQEGERNRIAIGHATIQGQQIPTRMGIQENFRAWAKPVLISCCLLIAVLYCFEFVDKVK